MPTHAPSHHSTSASATRARSAKRKSHQIVPRSISHAVAIKDEDVFFVCDASGSVPLGNVDGLGLYYHDCRYLDGYELRLADTSPNTLTSTSEHGYMSAFELTNHDLPLEDGTTIDKQRIAIRWERIVDAEQCSLLDCLTIRNFGADAVAFPLSLAFASAFEDVFTIRGFHAGKVGHAIPPIWKDGVLVLAYAGADGVHRSLHVRVDPAPQSVSTTGAVVDLALRPGQRVEVHVSLAIQESSGEADATPHQPRTRARIDRVTSDLHGSHAQWREATTDVVSDSPVLNMAIGRSLSDLRVLRSRLRGKAFYCGGLPWYGALFGRDSLVAAIETLAYDSSLADDTLRLLASYQGAEVDTWRDEEPGKILHELRRGELANLNEIPQTPYYGSVDATPLFLILLGLHAQWTGDLTLFHDLSSHVERAFQWIADASAASDHGYLTYESKSAHGLGNQGWKDSGDAIVNADGSLATPPIALVEVQGYVYLAKRLMADVYERAGDGGTATRMRREASELQKRFNRDFWLATPGTYALALQAGSRPAAVVSSNPGQALWSGIVNPDRAGKVVTHLMKTEMFSGWGLRTLSMEERRFNPIGYHLGTVWPHDNALIVAGLRRYGFDDAADRVMTGLLNAAEHFEHHRLPETFCGFSREEFSHPVRYPVACHPQAWAAGALPFILERMLGLSPRAFEKRLVIERPQLPGGVRAIELHRLRVGQASVDLRFASMPSGQVGVEVLRQDGELRVDIEPGPHNVGDS